VERLRYIGISIVETFLRVLPFPTKTGLIILGSPGADAPVFLTGNFRLTVERVRHALRGSDAYLLVANSRGVNVWCAATGGHLTHHDVVSVLKTSGIEALVQHRTVVLPQLAATGIESKRVQEASGWHVVWGPVEADALPEFVRRGLVKTEEMRRVRFPWRRRLEMAVAWAFPISLLTLLTLPLWPRAVLPLVALIWFLSLLIFLSFPWYRDRLRPSRPRVGFVLFDFGARGATLLLWGVFLGGLSALALALDEFSWDLLLRWGLLSFVVVLILSLDLTGSTPVAKSGLHEDRLLRIELDDERCKGAGACEDVCPTGVFHLNSDRSDRPKRHLVSLAHEERCVQCGACLVQCPFDALHFRHPDGKIVTPETVRRFKLNLMSIRRIPEKGLDDL